MKKLKFVIALFVFIFSLYLVIKGQTITNKWGLIMMLVGLCGFLLELYLYNKKQR